MRIMFCISLEAWLGTADKQQHCLIYKSSSAVPRCGSCTLTGGWGWNTSPTILVSSAPCVQFSLCLRPLHIHCQPISLSLFLLSCPSRWAVKKSSGLNWLLEVKSFYLAIFAPMGCTRHICRLPPWRTTEFFFWAALYRMKWWSLCRGLRT